MWRIAQAIQPIRLTGNLLPARLKDFGALIEANWSASTRASVALSVNIMTSVAVLAASLMNHYAGNDIMGLTFDGTITMGNLLQIVAFVGVGLFAFFRVQNKLDLLGFRVGMMEVATNQITGILQTMASQSQQISTLEREVADLRRGKGWVQRDLDGEYVKGGKITRSPDKS
jgi:hypothetical protein